MSKRNAPTIIRPDRIGERPLSPAVPAIILVAMVLASWILTELLAARLRFNPALGGHLGPVYAPWAWAMWVGMVYQPIAHMLHHAVAVYPADVYAAFSSFPIVAGIALLIGMAVAAAGIRVVQRNTSDASDIYDSGSRWATAKIASADHLLNAKAGPIVGGFDTSGGTRPLRYSGELGISYVEPPGGGKSSFLKSNLLIPLQHADAKAWNASRRRTHPWGEEPVIVASDPKFELFRETSGYQHRALGKTVHLLAPLGVASNVEITEDGLASYNPFWSIRLGTDRGFQDCYFRTLAIVDGEGEGLKTHWDRTALSWGAAVIEKLGYRALATGDYESFSLPGLLEYISSFASLEELLEHMLESPDDPAGVFGWTDNGVGGNAREVLVKPSIAQAVREMLNKDERERAGVYSTFITFLAPYRSEILRRYCTRSSFSWKELANDPARSSIIYLGMDPMDIPKLRPYLRMVLGDAVEELTSGATQSVDGRSARGNLRPVVMAMDEAAAWRRLQEIEHGSGYFRGYGVYLWLILQSVAQQKRYYGQENLLDETMDVLMYGRPKTADGAAAIQKMLGERTELVRKRSSSGGRFAFVAAQSQESVDVVHLPLLSEKEIMQIAHDRYIVLYNGHNYFLRKWEYFKNAALAQRAKIPHVRHARSSTSSQPIFARCVMETLNGAARERWNEYQLALADYRARTRAPGEAAFVHG